MCTADIKPVSIVAAKRESLPLEAASPCNPPPCPRNPAPVLGVDAPTASIVSKAKARKNKRDKDRGNVQSRDKAANAGSEAKSNAAAREARETRAAQQDRVPAVRPPSKMDGAGDAPPQMLAGPAPGGKRKAASSSIGSNVGAKHATMPSVSSSGQSLPLTLTQ